MTRRHLRYPWIALPMLVASSLAAQGPRGLIGPVELDRAGLVRIWFTQVDVDVARGGVTHLTQHVSSSQATTVFEVVHPGGKFVYRESDLDVLGRPIGKEAAQKRAEVKLADLQTQQVQAQLVTQTVPKITIYSVTNAARVQAIDGETGRTRWIASIGNARFPTEAVGANDEFVAAVNGSQIYLLKADTGELVWQRKVAGAPGAGPALSDAMVFVPMVNGAMEAYSLDSEQPVPTIFRSLGRAMIQPIYTGSNVAWPTDRGHLYVSGGTHHRINFRLEANDTIVAPASFLPPNMIVAASIDGFVYCVQETNGVLQWRFSAGEPIVTQPVIYGDSVYTVTADGTLFALESKIGQDQWSHPRMRQVIAASATRVYCLNDVGRLAILDRQTGSQLATLSTEFDDLHLVNQQTDRIIIGTSSGLIQAVRERSHAYPLLHVGLRKAEMGDAKRPAPRKTTPDAAPQNPADPFGGGGGGGDGGAKPAEPADPFGSGDAKPTPPSGAKPSDDPFGE